MREERKITFNELPEEITKLREQNIKLFAKMEEMSKALLTGAKKVNPYMTKQETAKFLGIGLTTLTEWTNEGLLEKHKVVNKVYYDRSECLALISRNKVKRA